MAVAPYTTEGDLAIDPRKLDDEPDLVRALEDAGFSLMVNPGTWIMRNIQIDFLVPTFLGGAGRRGARLGVHGTKLARKATGLEAAVVDNSLVRVSALEPGDIRTFDISLAGVAALVIAKIHKIVERSNMPDRLQDKDGLDVLRLLRHANFIHLAERLAKLEKHRIAGHVTRQARVFIKELFGSRDAIGARMAVRASAGLEDETSIAISCEVLARRLLEAWAQVA